LPHRGPGVSTKWMVLVVGLTLAAVLVPFLFWRATWFGRPLTDDQLGRFLTNWSDPRETQHALSQIADRIIAGDPSVKRWYPDVVRVAGCPVPELRKTVAWVMGQDNSVPEFHQALRGLLHDPEPMVRMNAALALVRFNDPSGHDEIVRTLAGEPLLAPEAGVLKRRMDVGQSVASGTVVAQILVARRKTDLQSALPGSLARWVAADGANVASGQPVAVIAPSEQMAWESLRALYFIGQPADLDVISPYARGLADMPPQIAQQARATIQQIRLRSGS
jgi:biotin carboxyl carrier protein